MNITPKILMFQLGGLTLFFTAMKPSQNGTVPSKQVLTTKPTSTDKDDDLSLKDVLSLVKDIDGLPAEMMAVIRPLLDTLRLLNLTGVKTTSLATEYLDKIYKLSLLKENKKLFDEAIKDALENGSMAEPAIAMNGDLVVQDSETGQLQTVSLKQYKANPDAYLILTVAKLKELRKWDPRLNFDLDTFDIIRNSMGYEAFEKLLKEAIGNLGKNTVSYNGYVTNEGEASKGWQLLKNLPKEDRERAIQAGLSAEGMYEYNIIDSSLLGPIQDLVTYLVAALPLRAKTWAAVRLGSDNPHQAIRDLVLLRLLAGNNTSHSFKIEYKGSMDHVMGNSKSKSGSGKEEDPKEGFWRQVQTDKGGESTAFNILSERGTLSVMGKYYGATPGLDKDCSLNDYLTASGVRFIVKDPKAITFGDTRISTDSFNDVMVNAGSGAFVATLPVKNGKVWIEIVDTYQEFLKELEGVSPVNKASKVRELLNRPEYMSLGPILESNGLLKPSNSGHFLILEGLTSSKASGISNSTGLKQSFKDIESNFILNAGDDENLYKTLEVGLSNKDRGEYKLDHNWISWNNDELFRGNIYIPLNSSPLSAAHADGNDIKESTARKYEAAQLTWEKDNIKGSTSSDVL